MGTWNPGRQVAADSLVELGRFAPPTLHALGARVASQLSRRMYNVLITNVPGPQVPLYAAGFPVEAMFPVAPLALGQALAVSCTSYNGGVYFGMTADREAIPGRRRVRRADPRGGGRVALHHARARRVPPQADPGGGGAGLRTSSVTAWLRRALAAGLGGTVRVYLPSTMSGIRAGAGRRTVPVRRWLRVRGHRAAPAGVPGLVGRGPGVRGHAGRLAGVAAAARRGPTTDEPPLRVVDRADVEATRR